MLIQTDSKRRTESMKKWIIIAVIGVMLMGLTGSVTFARDKKSSSSSKSEMGQIIKNQEKIMSTLQEIKKELQIIKIRTTSG